MDIGKNYKFIVDRETKLGYILTDANDDNSEEEFFLHHNECNGRVLKIGDVVSAFLYVDKKNRVAATLFKPIINLKEVGLLKVVNVNKEIGLFIHNGISKDILLPKEDLPTNYRLWPEAEDYLPVELKFRQGKLIMKIANKEKIVSNCQREDYLKRDDRVSGYVYRITADGINIATEDYDVVYIYKTNYRGNVHLGQKVDVRILDIHENDYSGTMIEKKEVQIQDDKKIILEYLNNHNGVMLITEESSPELINRLFNMSKGSFKKAIGGLLKENKIEILKDKIILVDFDI